ncbi:MAG: hypothetical protein J6J31_09120 [Thermoguttaceae bacterium]|nr:hypothetical protein [Thermoguttaceae bacterium]
MNASEYDRCEEQEKARQQKAQNQFWGRKRWFHGLTFMKLGMNAKRNFAGQVKFTVYFTKFYPTVKPEKKNVENFLEEMKFWGLPESVVPIQI